LNHPVHGGNLIWAAALADCDPTAILDFSASISPLGPPPSAIAAIQAHLHTMRAYPDPNYGAVRSALSDFHQLPPEWILPGNGAAELLTWAGRDLAALTATVLITPAFSDYGRALRAFGAKIVHCPLRLEDGAANQIPERASEQCHMRSEPPPNPAKFGGNTLQSPPAFENLGGLQGMRMQDCGLLLNNPHNPTGCLFARDAIGPYLDQFRLVVIDEAFMDFLPPDRQQSLIDQVQHHRNLIILRSLTKFYSLPGLRFGYAIAHPDILQQWQQYRDPWSVNCLASAAAIACVQDTAFQQQTWDWLAVAQPQLLAGLSALAGLQPFPSAANFFLVRSHSPVIDMQKHLLQTQQILIRDCLSFAELGDRYFRVAVKSETDNQRLLQGLAETLEKLSS
jgi:L-threonine-O-3-phosphate decarboxylase